MMIVPCPLVSDGLNVGWNEADQTDRFNRDRKRRYRPVSNSASARPNWNPVLADGGA